MKNVKEMKVGDLIRCGDETALVLDARWTTNYPQTQWVTTLWCDGTIVDFDTEHHSDSVEIISEGR
jgi:hypothetical protein